MRVLCLPHPRAIANGDREALVAAMHTGKARIHKKRRHGPTHMTQDIYGKKFLGSSQGAQLEVDTFDTPFDAIQQR